MITHGQDINRHSLILYLFTNVSTFFVLRGLFENIGEGEENAAAENAVVLIPDIFVEYGDRTASVEIYQII